MWNPHIKKVGFFFFEPKNEQKKVGSQKLVIKKTEFPQTRYYK